MARCRLGRVSDCGQGGGILPARFSGLLLHLVCVCGGEGLSFTTPQLDFKRYGFPQKMFRNGQT